MPNPLQRATHTGAGGFGHAPFDARQAHGYGRLGSPPSFRGGERPSQGMFPYAERSTMLRDLYPELFGGERAPGDEEWNDPLSGDEVMPFASRVGMNVPDADHYGISHNRKDRSSFVGQRLSLKAWHEREGLSLFEVLYNPSARDNPNSPRNPGGKQGWASPPTMGMHRTADTWDNQWADDDNAWTLEDIAAAAEENDELAKQDAR